MKFSKFMPVPVITGLLAFLYILLVQRISVSPWPGFITWAGYLLLKPYKSDNILRKAIGFTLGIFIGVLISIGEIYFYPVFGSYALALSVALATFIIISLEVIPYFDLAPSYFLGAAVFFAAGEQINSNGLFNIWIPGILGIIFGIITVYFRSKFIEE